MPCKCKYIGNTPKARSLIPTSWWRYQHPEINLIRTRHNCGQWIPLSGMFQPIEDAKSWHLWHSFQHRPWTFMSHRREDKNRILKRFHVLASGCMCLGNLACVWATHGFQPGRGLLALHGSAITISARVSQYQQGHWGSGVLQTNDPLNTQGPQTAKSRRSNINGSDRSSSFLFSHLFGSLRIITYAVCAMACVSKNIRLSFFVVFYGDAHFSNLVPRWADVKLICYASARLLVIPHHGSVIFQVAIQLVEVQGLRTERIRLVGELSRGSWCGEVIAISCKPTYDSSKLQRFLVFLESDLQKFMNELQNLSGAIQWGHSLQAWPFPFFKSILGSFKVSQNTVSSMFHPHSIFLANMLCPFAEVVGQGIERSICLAPAEAHVDLEYLDTLNYWRSKVEGPCGFRYVPSWFPFKIRVRSWICKRAEEWPIWINLNTHLRSVLRYDAS